MSIWAYWGELQFGWTPTTIGLTASLYGVMLAFAQAVLTGKSVHRFGAANTAKFALLFAVPSYLILAFAASTTAVVLAILVGSFAGMTLPALQSLMSLRVDDDAQGELQGAIASTLSSTAIIGPLVMTQTFAHFADDQGLYFPGAPFVISLASLVTAIIILWFSLRHKTAA